MFVREVLAWGSAILGGLAVASIAVIASIPAVMRLVQRYSHSSLRDRLAALNPILALKMNILRSLQVLFAFSLLGSVASFAQESQEPTVYHVVAYMKVSPENVEEYLRLESTWKKIHIARKASGVVDDWELLRVASPYGASVEYNFITRETYIGEDKLSAVFESPYMLDDWDSVLSDEEKALVERTSKIRTYVKREVWAQAAVLADADMRESKVRVVNYFDHPPGKTRADHFSVENEIWVPVHEHRIAQDQMQGWVLGVLVAPAGSSMPYQDLTVDVYKSTEDMLTTPYEELFEAVHPGKPLNEIFATTQANANLVKSEIRISIDKID